MRHSDSQALTSAKNKQTLPECPMCEENSGNNVSIIK